MRGEIGIRAATLVTLLVCACGARAEEYTFNFDPGSPQLVDSKGDNGANIGRVFSLMQDFGAGHGIQFVLLGEVPAECMGDLKCDEAKLLRRRVEAVSERVIALSGSGNSVQQLRWQPVPTATPHLEGLTVRIRDLASQTFSAQCPFHVQVSDPRLPRTIAADGADQDWVTLVGAVPVPVTDKTLIRVRLGSNPTSQAQLAARQSLKDEQTTLDSGSEQIQWSATQFKWGEGGAEVIVEARLVSRDIDNELQSWDRQGSSPAAPASDAPGCRINFQLLEPHDQAPSPSR